MLNPKSAQEIYNKYPLLFKSKSIQCRTGWLRIIEEMCAATQVYIDFELGANVSQVEFTEIKERYGVLHISFTGGDKVIDHIVDLCQRISYKTCEFCGKIGDLYCSTKWRKWCFTKTLCTDHAVEFLFYRIGPEK